MPNLRSDLAFLAATLLAAAAISGAWFSELVLGFVPCLVLAAVVVLAIAWFRVPLAWVLLGVGGVACGLTWRKLTP